MFGGPAHFIGLLIIAVLLAGLLYLIFRKGFFSSGEKANQHGLHPPDLPHVEKEKERLTEEASDKVEAVDEAANSAHPASELADLGNKRSRRKSRKASSGEVLPVEVEEG